MIDCIYSYKQDMTIFVFTSLFQTFIQIFVLSTFQTVKWIFFATLTKMDRSLEMYTAMTTALGLLCPITMLIGCTLLGIVVMYATAGQVDGKVLISYLLPTVDLVSAVTTSDLKRKTRYWKFAGVCIGSYWTYST